MGMSRFFDGQHEDDQPPFPGPAWPQPQKPQRQLQAGYVGGLGHGPTKFRASPHGLNTSIPDQQSQAIQQIASVQQQLHRPQQQRPPQQQLVAQAPQPARPQPAQRPSAGGASMPAGGPNVNPPSRPERQLAQQIPQRQQASPADWMHPMQREGLGQYNAALKASNDAVAAEMQSRADQAMELDRMAHEENMAAMANQAKMAQHQDQMQLQKQELARRDAKNAALMKAAGIGGHTIVNGKRVDPFSSIRQSLLG